MKTTWIGLAVGVCLGALIGGVAVSRWDGSSLPSAQRAPAPGDDSGETDGLTDPADVTTLVVSAEKASQAGLSTTRATRKELRAVRWVPGRLRYDEDRHVSLKVPVAGILTDVKVQPGDAVRQGQVVATMSSPEIGTARAELLLRQSEFELAERNASWKRETARGVEKLIAAIGADRDPEAIDRELSGQRLGNYRATLLQALTRYRLAKQFSDGSTSLASQGAISGRTVQQRLSETESADATLKAEMEQARFAAEQESATADATVADAGRRTEVARQHLTSLLGYTDSAAGGRDESKLSEVEILAPFDGTIESRELAKSERIDAGASLLMIADTSRLWVAADIRQREWPAIGLRRGETIEIEAPGLSDPRLNATIVYVGREVDASTGAVPLVATLPNTRGNLRPGQFVRVALPMEASREAVTIPSSAIVVHENQSYVFSPMRTSAETADPIYQRIEVQTGTEQEGMTEIIAGIDVGDTVVSGGAFALKSQWLLEGEE